MALVMAPSYQKKVREQYYMEESALKEARDYVDTFGFAQKNLNAVDILIEDTKQLMSSWGADSPDFMLTSGKLCFQLTMTQERTSYIAKGDDGANILKEGPMMDKYRGLSIVKSRAFSMEEGAAPRDVLRRRVRTSEFYFGKVSTGKSNALTSVTLYDEASDNFMPLGVEKIQHAWDNQKDLVDVWDHIPKDDKGNPKGNVETWLLVRPNIEHWMLGTLQPCVF